jgi:hypothetical protein
VGCILLEDSVVVWASLGTVAYANPPITVAVCGDDFLALTNSIERSIACSAIDVVSVTSYGVGLPVRYPPAREGCFVVVWPIIATVGVANPPIPVAVCGGVLWASKSKNRSIACPTIDVDILTRLGVRIQGRHPPAAKAGATLVAITTIIRTTTVNNTTMRFIRVSPPLHRTTRPSVKGYNDWCNFREHPF